MDMITELGEYDFMIVLTHARNLTANVDFGALLSSLGEEAFRNVMKVVAFNRHFYPLEYSNSRCKTFFDNTLDSADCVVQQDQLNRTDYSTFLIVL